METWWILALVGRRDPALALCFFSLFRIYVLVTKARRWRLFEDGMRFSSSSPHPVVRLASACEGVSSAELMGFSRCLSSVDPRGSGLCLWGQVATDWIILI